jgi:S-methylmethionine-dependent homocysteine/selenocysteine methylase
MRPLKIKIYTHEKDYCRITKRAYYGVIWRLGYLSSAKRLGARRMSRRVEYFQTRRRFGYWAGYIAAGADLIGTNCGNGMEDMIGMVKEIRTVNSTIPVLVHANAGMPCFVDGRTTFPETPEDMAARVKEIIAAGANIVGGCCGTTPEHIRKIREAVIAS